MIITTSGLINRRIDELIINVLLPTAEHHRTVDSQIAVKPRRTTYRQGLTSDRHRRAEKYLKENGAGEQFCSVFCFDPDIQATSGSLTMVVDI